MSCKCSIPLEDSIGWGCAVTGGPCKYLLPNSRVCAIEWGEGPDAHPEGLCSDCVYLKIDNEHRWCDLDGMFEFKDGPLQEQHFLHDKIIGCGDFRHK